MGTQDGVLSSLTGIFGIYFISQVTNSRLYKRCTNIQQLRRKQEKWGKTWEKKRRKRGSEWSIDKKTINLGYRRPRVRIWGRLFNHPHPNLKFYFGLGWYNLADIFRRGVSWAGHLTVKISARNIGPTKLYLEIKGENIGVRASQISPAFQTLESSGWF